MTNANNKNSNTDPAGTNEKLPQHTPAPEVLSEEQPTLEIEIDPSLDNVAQLSGN
ncbi:MAG: hypothetical protein V7629_01980 [Motiliproteus sp.]